MNWWIIYMKDDIPGSQNAIGYYRKACEKRGIGLRLITYEDFSMRAGGSKNACTEYLDKGELLGRPEAVINRTRDPELAKLFEEDGIRVFNDSFLTRIGNDKYAALQFAAKLGVPVMETECSYGAVNENGSSFDFPYVVKSVSGHGGTEVFLVHSEEERREAVKKIRQRTDEKILYQRPASDKGRDLRIYMIGKTPVASMLRISDSDFRSNFCLGGKCEIHELTEEEKEIAGRIASACTIDYCGIDLIYDKGHPVFNEIEDAVGARMIYINTDLDILDRYVEYIREQCESEKQL